jgi:hypothetical protein
MESDARFRRNVIKVRAEVVEFRERWISEMKKHAARTLEHETGNGQQRHVFLVRGQKVLVDAFEDERVQIERRISRLYENTRHRHCRTLWLPSLVRNCTALTLMKSPAISQQVLSTERELWRIPKAEVDAAKGTDTQFVQRRKSGNRYALAVTVSEGGAAGRREVGFTEWVVIEAKGKITREGCDLRERSREPHNSDGKSEERWMQKRQARLVSSKTSRQVFALTVKIDF